MEFSKWWEENSREQREKWVMLGAFVLPGIAKAAWDAAKTDKAICNCPRCSPNTSIEQFYEDE